MPEIGEIRKAPEIGYKGRDSFIFQACADCGEKRWVKSRRGKAVSERCRSCMAKRRNKNGIESPHWKGGRVSNRDYVSIKLQPGDPFISMANSNRYIYEHRLVMAEHLGRCLLEEEIVHHIDGNGQNNSLGNLMLFPSHSAHRQYHVDNEPTIRVNTK